MGEVLEMDRRLGNATRGARPRVASTHGARQVAALFRGGSQLGQQQRGGVPCWTHSAELPWGEKRLPRPMPGNVQPERFE